MSEFQKYLTNGNYLKAKIAHEEGNKNSLHKGYVYIEDDSDQTFWETFIELYFPNKYKIQASIIDRPMERGKRALEKFYNDVNENFLVAVDSDYDLICPENNLDHATSLTNNKFIIHTFGYSRESALLEKNNLNTLFKKTKYTVNHNVNIKSFLDKFSKVAYYGLVFFSTALENENPNNIIIDEFHNCFNILKFQIVKSDLTLDENLINDIQKNISNLFQGYYYPSNQLKKSENNLINLGINQGNSYRFICGHTLYNLIIKIHKELKDKLFDLELDIIKKNFTGSTVNQRRNQLKKEFEKFSIETLCNSYPINENDEIHHKIKEKIAAIPKKAS